MSKLLKNHAPRSTDQTKPKPFKTKPVDCLETWTPSEPIWAEQRGHIKVEVYEHAKQRNVEPFWAVRIRNVKPDPHGMRTKMVLRENLSTSENQVAHLSELLTAATRVVETRRQVLLEQFVELQKKYESFKRRRAAHRARWARKRYNENATKGIDVETSTD